MTSCLTLSLNQERQILKMDIKATLHKKIIILVQDRSILYHLISTLASFSYYVKWCEYVLFLFHLVVLVPIGAHSNEMEVVYVHGAIFFLARIVFNFVLIMQPSCKDYFYFCFIINKISH